MYREKEGYSATPPAYEPFKKFNHTKDVVNIMVSQVFIWQATADDWFSGYQSGFLITEVESIEINNSYKELIGTATLRFPRGVLIKKATPEKTVKTGENTGDDREIKFKETTDDGMIVVPQSAIDKNDESTLRTGPLDADTGLIESSYRADKQTIGHDVEFSTGWRVMIRLGYINSEDEEKDEKLKTVRNGGKINDMFDRFNGFITGISVTTPLEIQCENMASVFKRKNAPNLIAKRDYKVSDFLGEKSTFDLLKDTGITLHPDSLQAGDDIDIGKVNLTTNVNVSDIFDEWTKCGISCMMTEDGKQLRVGKMYDTKDYNSDSSQGKQVTLQRHPGMINYIYGDWDVASDRLEIKAIDKAFLAIKVNGFIAGDKKNKAIGFTLRLDPSMPVDPAKKAQNWQIVNEHEPKDKKAQKNKKGAKGVTGVKNKVDLSKYTIDTFHGGIVASKQKLIEAAKTYFQNYDPIDVSGSITVFGDLDIYPTDIIGLIMPNQQERDGYYLVEQVSIKFSANEGYRQELKLPNRLQGFTNKVKIIWE